MKRNALLSSGLALAFVMCVMLQCALAYPAREGFVTDKAEYLTTAQEQTMENDLSAFYQTTGITIAVVTVRSLNGESVADYASNVADNWKLDANSVVFLTADDEGLVRIETGDGIKSRLSDGQAQSIMDNTITPLYNNGQMADGLIAGVNKIMSSLKSAAKAQSPVAIVIPATPAARPAAPVASKPPSDSGSYLIPIAAIVILLGGTGIFVAKRDGSKKKQQQDLSAENAKQYETDQTRSQKLLELETNASKALKTLNDNYPPSVRADVEKAFNSITDQTDAKSYDSTIFSTQLLAAGDVIKRGPNESQKAQQLLEAWETRASEVESVMQAVVDKLAEVDAAKDNCGNKLADLAQLLQNANEAVVPDVATSCRPDLEKAKTAYQNAAKTSQEAPNTVDWIALQASIAITKEAAKKIISDAAMLKKAKEECNDSIAGLVAAFENIGARDKSNTSTKTLMDIAKAQEAFIRAKDAFGQPADKVDWIQLRDTLRGLESTVAGVKTTADEEKAIAGKIAETPDEMLAKMEKQLEDTQKALGASEATQTDLEQARYELENARNTSGASPLDMYLYMTAMNNSLQMANHHHYEAVRIEQEHAAETLRRAEHSGASGSFGNDHRASWEAIHTGATGSFHPSPGPSSFHSGAGGSFHPSSSPSSFHSSPSVHSGATGGFHHK